MTTSASIGYGTLFKVLLESVYTVIGEQTNVTPYGIAVDSVDASHEQSPGGYREFIPGMKDSGEATFEINYVPGGTAEQQLFAMIGTTQTCRTVWPSGAYAQYSAFITAIEPEAPMDDKMVASITLKISGEITRTAATAPTSSVLPAVSGTLTQGSVLTAFEGQWNNEPTSFTYQWKAGGTNISGAVNKTYTLTSGEATKKITVAVTAINSAGNASATSPATDAVV